MEKKLQPRQIKLSSLLSLSLDDIKRGFAKFVRRKERKFNSLALYCSDVEEFHKEFFPCNLWSNAEGVGLCCLELRKDLWLLTKVVKYENGVPKEIFTEYAGRLQINFNKRNHSGDIKLKCQIGNMTVHSILDRQFSFLRFEGYHKVRLKFEELKRIVELNFSDWRQALQNVFGVYLISDTKQGGAYVGSAYGKGGLWGRWSSYVVGVSQGHGGDKGLIERIGGDSHYPNNFKFSILEVMGSNCTEKIVRDRESWWKDTLRTRENHNNNGMNEN